MVEAVWSDELADPVEACEVTELLVTVAELAEASSLTDELLDEGVEVVREARLRDESGSQGWTRRCAHLRGGGLHNRGRAWASGMRATTSASTPVPRSAVTVSEALSRERRRRAASRLFCARVLIVSVVAVEVCVQ